MPPVIPAKLDTACPVSCQSSVQNISLNFHSVFWSNFMDDYVLSGAATFSNLDSWDQASASLDSQPSPELCLISHPCLDLWFEHWFLLQSCHFYLPYVPIEACHFLHSMPHWCWHVRWLNCRDKTWSSLRSFCWHSGLKFLLDHWISKALKWYGISSSYVIQNKIKTYNTKVRG